MEKWQKQWIINLVNSCEGNRLLAAKRMSEISRQEIKECWQLLEQVMPMTSIEREKYRLLGLS
jgi:hypothetical protein